MRTLVGLLLVGAAASAFYFGVSGMIVSARMSRGLFPYDPLSIYVHALWFVAAALSGWAGARVLRDGYLDRLVRGRGLTPAPRRS